MSPPPPPQQNQEKNHESVKTSLLSYKQTISKKINKSRPYFPIFVIKKWIDDELHSVHI